MEQRRIGDSELVCSPVGFGSWEISGAWGQIDVTEARRTVSAAIDSGINLFDTAESYGPFMAEELLGQALGRRRNDVIVVTKIGVAYDERGKVTGYDASRPNLLKRFAGCLRRLRSDWVDLVLIHWPDHRTPHDETMGAQEELKAAGKLRYYGVSNYNVPMMGACRRYGHIVANQVGYHLFDRRMEAGVLPYCQARSVGFMSYGTLGFGLLTGALTPQTPIGPPVFRNGGVGFGIPLFQKEHYLRELRVVERLKGLAAGYGRTVAQLAIAWVLGQPAVSVALVGMKSQAELAEDVAATDWRLTAEDRAEIDRIFEEEECPTFKNVPQCLH